MMVAVAGLRSGARLPAHVVSYLELRKQPYTGCNPRGLTLARWITPTRRSLSTFGCFRGVLHHGRS
jgi:hypothetical protein